MAVKVGELYGELRLEKKQFDESLDQAEGKARGWSSRVGGILTGAAGFLAKWGAIGGTAVAGFGYATANMASDLSETVSKVNVVFGDAGDEVLAWAENSASALGMSKNAALGAAGTYGNLFQAMGVGREAATEMSTGLVDLAADLASFNNMDPTEVLDALRAGLSGETEPLKRLGVNLNQATIEAKAMEMGLWDGVGALSNNAKAQATYALTLEQTSLAQGDFERTSGGMANQQRILSATIQDAGAKIGEAFMPIILMVLPQLIEMIGVAAEWITANMTTIQAVVETVFSAVGAAITFLFTEVLPLLVAAFTFFVEEILPIFSAGVGTVTTDVVPALGAVFEWIYTNIMPALIAVFEVITNVILPALVAAFTAVVSWVTANWPLISSVAGQVAGAVSTAFQVISAIIQAVWPVIEAVASVLFPLLGAGATLLLGTMDTTFKIIGAVWQTASDVAGTVVDAISGAWNTLRSATSTVWNAISGAVKGAINAVIGAINTMIRAVNSIQIHIPRVGIGPAAVGPFDWWGLNLSQIPYLARGIKGFPGGWAVVGEAGPELVNLPTGSDVYPSNVSARMGGGFYNNGPLLNIERFEATTPGYDVDELDRRLGERMALRFGRSWSGATG